MPDTKYTFFRQWLLVFIQILYLYYLQLLLFCWEREAFPYFRWGSVWTSLTMRIPGTMTIQKYFFSMILINLSETFMWCSELREGVNKKKSTFYATRPLSSDPPNPLGDKSRLFPLFYKYFFRTCTQTGVTEKWFK